MEHRKLCDWRSCPSTHVPRFGRALLLAAILALICVALPAAANDDLESQVKATFLLRFTGFVEWPEDAFAEATSPFVIGVQGDSALSRELQKLQDAGQRAQGRRIEIVRLRRLSDATNEHIVFSGGRLTSSTTKQLQELCGQPILSVTESPGAAKDGAIVNFYNQDNKIKFEVNRHCEQAGGLRISSRMLSLARIVKGRVPGSSP